MSTIVFAHGWGFDGSVWDAVRECLGAQHRAACIDFGFFGKPQMPHLAADTPVIAVGHSLGACWWLSQATPRWQRLLLINGFPRFTATSGYPQAVAPRVLNRMIAQFGRDPGGVLAEFRVASGAPLPPDTLDATQLAAGLDWLAQWDGRARLAERAADIWAIASEDDPIVPAAMTRMALSSLAPQRLTLTASAGHVLPLTAPQRCADLIAQLIHT